VAQWLDNREPEVKRETTRNYRLVVDKHLTPALGHFRVVELTTAQIRRWHQDIRTGVGAHTANAAKKYLRAALALAAEDHNIPVAAMPSRLGRGRTKAQKVILAPEEVARLIRHARTDPRGLYYTFPFLTGVRPSEQLGLLWTDVDLEAGVVRIRRMLERFGTLCDVTKTAAGLRDIPIGPVLREMLTAWRGRCPQRDAAFPFVFPAPHGGPYLYWNFRRREWKPGLLAAGVRYVTPHSARHAFISTLQAQGFEVALVAKLAGHTPAVSVGHYTQAIRNGDAAMRALEEAYSA
jgi:integrase